MTVWCSSWTRMRTSINKSWNRQRRNGTGSSKTFKTWKPRSNWKNQTWRVTSNAFGLIGKTSMMHSRRSSGRRRREQTRWRARERGWARSWTSARKRTETCRTKSETERATLESCKRSMRTCWAGWNQRKKRQLQRIRKFKMRCNTK